MTDNFEVERVDLLGARASRDKGIGKVEFKDLIPLAKKFSIDKIESSLVKIFCERNGLKPKSTTISKLIDNASDATTKEIDEYLIKRNITLSLKNLERIFELLVAGSDRKLNGIFYTPTYIVEYIIKNAIAKSKNYTICDPSCGAGAFLVESVELLSKKLHKPFIEIIENHIYGADILPRSIKRARIILTLLALQNGENVKEIQFNLIQGDSLTIDWKQKFPEIFKDGGFDAVVGNPPYVRIQNLPLKKREELRKRWATTTSGNIDLFIPFVELGMNIINYDGILGLIIPNSYFNSVSTRKLRQFLQQNRYIDRILDFNHLQIFDDVLTYTCISFFDRKPKEGFEYLCKHDTPDQLANLEFLKINYASIDPKQWNLLGKSDFENIRKIENIGTPLGHILHINIGIATLKNEIYVIENAVLKDGYYEQTWNGESYKIEKGITKEIIKASVIKDEKEIEENSRRIIFPYKKVEGKYVILTLSEMSERYPMCFRYLKVVKPELQKRDRGNREYETWYAYGRSQGIMNGTDEKILTPDISAKPRFVILRKEALFYCGYGIKFNKQKTLEGKETNLDIESLAKILNSSVLWYYIKNTSKNYSNGYKSFAKHFIERFAVPELTHREVEFLKSSSQEKANEFLIKKYELPTKALENI